MHVKVHDRHPFIPLLLDRGRHADDDIVHKAEAVGSLPLILKAAVVAGRPADAEGARAVLRVVDGLQHEAHRRLDGDLRVDRAADPVVGRRDARYDPLAVMEEPAVVVAALAALFVAPDARDRAAADGLDGLEAPVDAQRLLWLVFKIPFVLARIAARVNGDAPVSCKWRRLPSACDGRSRCAGLLNRLPLFAALRFRLCRRRRRAIGSGLMLFNVWSTTPFR